MSDATWRSAATPTTPHSCLGLSSQSMAASSSDMDQCTLAQLYRRVFAEAP